MGRPAAVMPSSEPEPWHPRLIFPNHHNESFEWLDQIHQMFDRAQFRVRHVDYENAPIGHDVFAASPYRWWLGFLALGHHLAAGGPLDRSIERVALFADPLVLIILLGAGTVLVARRLGPAAAAFFSLGLVALFPFASAYLPASPDSSGLARALGIAGELLILAGILERERARATAALRMRRWFFGAGVAGGLSLWISVPVGVPIALGVAGGAAIAAWAERRQARDGKAPAAEPLPWRLWGLGGALTILVGFLVEFFPSYIGAWEFRSVHPAFGLACWASPNSSPVVGTIGSRPGPGMPCRAPSR